MTVVGLFHSPETRLGLKSEANSKSRLKLTSCTNVSNRQDACSTKSEFYCGTGILPVHKRLVENGARYQLKPTQILIFSPLKRTFAMRQGFQPLPDFGKEREKLTQIGGKYPTKS